MKIIDLKIKGITSNSKQVKKDYLFVAIKGASRDGNLFIQEAVKRGAAVVVVEKEMPQAAESSKVLFWIVKDARNFLAQATHQFYGRPSEKIRVAGITGTNGKTTIAYLIEAIAGRAGKDCGVIGTINYRYKGRTIPAKNTTPGASELQELLMKMREAGVGYCAMEVSSHALDQQRTAGINFSQAIFTNLTQDHLDYHKNLKNYFLAKSKLFTNLGSRSWAIINNDDRSSKRLKSLAKGKLLTYGIKKKSDLMAKDIKAGMESTEFSLVTPRAGILIKTGLVGRHNIYNILAAVSWAVSEKIHLLDIKEAIEGFRPVPGRLERVPAPQGLNIFIDYAHTPDALFNVISALRPLVKGKIVVVFGCGGDRDRLKRPKMGKIVSQLADFAIITNDNPRSEEPGQIIKEIKQGIQKKNYLVIKDRFKAIRKGIAMLKNGDCLLIAGKGHEDYQIIKDKIHPFSDRKAALQCLESMK